MAVQITSTKTPVGNSLYANIVIYGEAGIGKTYLARGIDQVLVISSEGESPTLADVDVPIVYIDTLEDLIEVYNKLKSGAWKFKTAFIDSASDIAQVILAKYKGEERDPRKAYGRMAEEVIAAMRKFKKLPLHVVFVAKLERSEDAMNSKLLYRPSFPGKVLSQEVPYLVDVIAAMKLHKHEGQQFRILQCDPDIQWVAKNRGGRLQTLEKPDVQNMINKLTAKTNGDVKAETEPKTKTKELKNGTTK